MKVMLFRTQTPERPARLPEDATNVHIDHLLRCETNAAVSPDSGIVTSAPEQPWTTVVSFSIPEELNVAELEQIRDQSDSAAAAAVSAVELLPDSDDGFPVKNLGVLRRRPDAAAQQFADYWRGHHAKITLSYEPAFGRYTTNTVDIAVGEFPWDGIVEQYFGSLDDLAEHVRLARDGRPRITADIPEFVSRMIMFAAEPVSPT